MIPGTFDPVTIGHYDIVVRAGLLFDEVLVTAFENSRKATFFSPEQRYEMLKLSFGDMKNVRVDITNKLTVDYAKEHEVKIIIKGVRNMIDYDYEYQLSLINREFDNEIETLLLPSKREHMYVSSTFVKELILYKKDMSKYVPTKVSEYINSIIV